MKKIIIFGLMVLLTIGMVSAYDEWTTGVTYQIDDIVTYQGTDYICIQSHTSQAGWTPPVVPALWNVYEAPNNNGTWQVGIYYEVGDIVTYEEQQYKVRQAHTSQADWLPPIVLALYLPVHTEPEVAYLPPETNLQPIDFASMTEQELIDFMEFTYVGAETKDNGVMYSWNYLKPELETDGTVKWIFKPMQILLGYDRIEECLLEYQTAQCVNILVTGTDQNLINNQTVTSVKNQAQNGAYSVVQQAIQFQQEVLYELDAQSYLIETFTITPTTSTTTTTI